jgi:hypothetical protein
MANVEANQTLFISATAKANISKFKEVLYDEVKKIHDIRYPYNAYLY